MKLTCPGCATTIEIPGSKLPPGGAITCNACGQSIREPQASGSPVIALGGSTAPQAPASPHVEHSEVIALSGSTPTPSPKPASATADLGGNDNLPAPAESIDDLFDLPAAMVDDPPSAPTVPGPPSFLEDLPAPSDHAAVNGLEDLPESIGFDSDLPEGTHSPTAGESSMDDLPTGISASDGDLPGSVTDLDDDLPMASADFLEDIGEDISADSNDSSQDLPTSIAFMEGPTDLPELTTPAQSAQAAQKPQEAEVEAPSLMDDLPAATYADPAGMPQAAIHNAQTTPSFDPPTLDDISGQDSGTDPFAAMMATTGTPVPLPDTPSNATAKLKQALGKTPKRKRLIIVLGALGAVGLLYVLTKFAPELGTLGNDNQPPIADIDKAISQAQEHPQNKDPAKDVVNTNKESPKVYAADPLRRDNVDTIHLMSLSAAVNALKSTDDADPSVHMWALFRLAYELGDAAAQEELASAPRVDLKTPPMQAAAWVGGQILAGKLPAARKLAESLRRHHKDSGRVTYVTALATRPPRIKEKHLERAVKLTPNLAVAQLDLADLLLQGREIKRGETLLTDLVKVSTDPDVHTRAAILLRDAGATQLLETIVGKFEATDLEQVAPHRQSDFAGFILTRELIAGNVQGALTQWQAFLKTLPLKTNLVLQGAELDAATDADYDKVSPKLRAILISTVIPQRSSTTAFV
ncbi:MAG: hypothetical protein R3C68_04820 [Myxococcota bacterium]